MKTIVKTSALTLLMMVACEKAGMTNNQQETDKNASATPLTSSTPSTKPNVLISLQSAKNQLGKYQNAHPGVNGDEYALRTWISLQDLEQYIAFVKEISKDKNITVNGIDIIYTQKIAGAPGLPNPNNSQYGLTLMMAPTYKDGTHNTAFDPVASKYGEPAKLSDLLANAGEFAKEEESRPSTPSPGTPSGIANSFNSCPSVCP